MGVIFFDMVERIIEGDKIISPSEVKAHIDVLVKDEDKQAFISVAIEHNQSVRLVDAIRSLECELNEIRNTLGYMQEKGN